MELMRHTDPKLTMRTYSHLRVLSIVRPELVQLGFAVEGGKTRVAKIERPVFYGENGRPTLNYQIDAYHRNGSAAWKSKLAGHGWGSRHLAACPTAPG